MPQPPRQSELPVPAAPGEGPVVIYDGQCNFCRGGIQRLAKLDWLGRLSFLSLHSAEVRQYAPNLTHDQLMREMYLVTSTGRQYAGAAAFRRIAWFLPVLWLALPVLYIPFSLPVWNYLYQCVAVRRYQIAGKSDCEGGTCHLHFGGGEDAKADRELAGDKETTRHSITAP